MTKNDCKIENIFYEISKFGLIGNLIGLIIQIFSVSKQGVVIGTILGLFIGLLTGIIKNYANFK